MSAGCPANVSSSGRAAPSHDRYALMHVHIIGINYRPEQTGIAVVSTVRAEYLAAQGKAVPVLHLGLPDRFVEHGDPALLLKQCGLDGAGILAAVRARLPD